MTDLSTVRLDEIRTVLAELTARQHHPADGHDVRDLLARARRALADVIADRDDLARANSAAAAELALWTGVLR